MNRKILINAAAFCFYFIVFMTGAFFVFRSPKYTDAPGLNAGAAFPADSAALQVMPQEAPTTTLAFVGDIMLDRAVRTSVDNNFSGDYLSLFSKVGSLASADILFANLEGPVSDKGIDRHNLYSFRMATSTLPALASVGFDALSVANNHIGDWGRDAFEDTLARVRTVGIAPVGGGETKAIAETPQILVRNGIRFGFLGATDVGPDWLAATASSSGILLAGDPELPSIIARAKKQVDVLVVSVHWGIEYATSSSARQQMLGHEMVDAGADLVIGTHPHVREEMEAYHGGMIAYSLGNFVFDQYWSNDVTHGDALLVHFSGKNIASEETKTVTISRQSQPSLK